MQVRYRGEEVAGDDQQRDVTVTSTRPVGNRYGRNGAHRQNEGAPREAFLKSSATGRAMQIKLDQAKLIEVRGPNPVVANPQERRMRLVALGRRFNFRALGLIWSIRAGPVSNWLVSVG